MIDPRHQTAIGTDLASIRPEIEALFADLWRHPELPAMEHRTAGILATWGKIRALYGDRAMPHTGDIDQTLVRGAHGPRRQHVVIAEE